MVAKRITRHTGCHKDPSLLIRRIEAPLHARVPGVGSGVCAIAATAGTVGFPTYEGAGGRLIADVVKGRRVADGAGVGGLTGV